MIRIIDNSADNGGKADERDIKKIFHKALTDNKKGEFGVVLQNAYFLQSHHVLKYGLILWEIRFFKKQNGLYAKSSQIADKRIRLSWIKLIGKNPLRSKVAFDNFAFVSDALRINTAYFHIVAL